jgi:hypothetical protein
MRGTSGSMLLDRSESRQEAFRCLIRPPDICPKRKQATRCMDKSLEHQGGDEEGAALFERVGRLAGEEPAIPHPFAMPRQRVNGAPDGRNKWPASRS